MPERTLASPRAFFDAIARRYDRDYALSGPTSRARLARVMEEIRGRTRVLVLGLGTGRELPALLDAGHAPTGLDVSPAMIAECNKRSRTAPIVLGDFWEPLPFEARSFDAAIALHGTLAHPPSAEDPVAALGRLGAELARVLASGGVFVAEAPAAEALARITASREGMHVAEAETPAPAGVRRFVHHDEGAGLDVEGVALERRTWTTALGPAFAVRIEDLGETEHRVVATRLAW